MSRTRWRAFRGKQHGSRSGQAWFRGQPECMMEWLGPLRPIEGFLYTAFDKTFGNICEPRTGWLFHAERTRQAEARRAMIIEGGFYKNGFAMETTIGAEKKQNLHPSWRTCVLKVKPVSSRTHMTQDSLLGFFLQACDIFGCHAAMTLTRTTRTSMKTDSRFSIRARSFYRMTCQGR